MRMGQVKPKTRVNDQSGIASLFVVILLMTVLALVSVGFSRLMNKELSKALDRQLSAGAYYAAESAVNDARAYLAKGGAATPGCAVPTAGPQTFVLNGDVTGNNNVRYNCVAINTSPNFLTFDLKKPGDSTVFILNQPALNNLWFSWQRYSTSIGSTFRALGPFGTLPKEDAQPSPATDTGILRVAIYPIKNGLGGGADTNAQLTTDSRNYFMYPSSGGPNAAGTVGYGSNGGFVRGNCRNTPSFGAPYPGDPLKSCNSIVQGLVSSGNQYYVRVTAMYTGLSGYIYATNPAGNPLPAQGNQTLIDATGTAGNVSRRISSVVSSTPQFDIPVNALWSMQAVCKLFRVPVPSLTNYGSPTDLDGSTVDVDGQCSAATPINGGGPVNPPPPPPPPSPPTVIITAAPNPIVAGAFQSILSWSSTDTTSCTGSGGWGGPLPTVGVTGTGLIGSTTTYGITCVGPGGAASDSVTVVVIPPPPPTTCTITSVGHRTIAVGVEQAYATGGCTDGSANWSYTYNSGSPCFDTGGGPGNLFTANYRGSWTVTFTLTGNTGGSASVSTSFPIGGGIVCG